MRPCTAPLRPLLPAAALLLLVGCGAQGAGPAAPDAGAEGDADATGGGDGGADAGVPPDAGDEVGVFDEGAPGALRLGVLWSASQTSLGFRLYSSRATRVELLVYAEPYGAQEVASYPMTLTGGGRWAKDVSLAALRAAGAGETIYYGYRAWGPNWPYDPAWRKGSLKGFLAYVDAEGNRFNPNKVLLDPYAREVSHDMLNARNSSGTWFGTGADAREIDSGRWAPKGIVLPPASTSTTAKPTRSLADDVIYEVHLRGLTMDDPSIPAPYRGTYRGAALKAPALAALGVTAVEFLPLQEHENDHNDVAPTTTVGDDYWGYSTLNWFAPDRRYAADRTPGGPTRELRAMVHAFHAVGIKVLVDVVYNHTVEGGPWRRTDPTAYTLVSWRGLDQPTYYSLTTDKQYPWDNTGIGGNYNTYNGVAQKLVVDSLVYWRDVLGVDGFRYDLAAILGNTCEHGCFRFDKLDPGSALNRIARELSPRPMEGGPGVDLIAEPWAIGEGTFQVGNFPAGFAEWNGVYRDQLRADQNQLGVAAVTPGQLATRIAGSSDLYADDGRRPWHSVNFLVAHDGFTLHDLYACNTKNNAQAWPYGPSDGGSDDNRGWDQGGSAADQRKAARTGLALLLLSAGTPMITGGDEYLRSLRCNNNPYNLDSAGNWLTWTWTPEQSDFRAFAERMLAFRLAHGALRPATFLQGVDGDRDGMQQLAWFQPSGAPADAAYMDDPNNHALGWRLDARELGDAVGALYVAYDGWSGDVAFTLPWPGEGRSWYRVTDTCPWAEGPEQVAPPGREAAIGGEGTAYTVCGRGLAVFVAR